MIKAPDGTAARPTRDPRDPVATRPLRFHGSVGRLRGCALVLLVSLGATGCGDDGPSGPGMLEATVTAGQGTQLGAAALRLTGNGIQSIEEAGDTRLFVSALTSTDYRVVLVDPTPGTLTFDVQVADVGAAPPSVTVTSAADGDNRPVQTLGEVRVRFAN